MPTYIKTIDNIGGVFDKGAGYLSDMQWHLEATGGYSGWNGDFTAWSAGVPPNFGFTPNEVALYTNQHREFHYRFIAVPNPLVLNNPPYDTPIEWRLWNTFPLDDTAVTATITGSSVVTSSFGVGTTMRDFQWRALDVQVSEGEVEINADLFGDFTQGDFTLNIIGIVVLTIEDLPVDGTVRERWTWNTKVITSWDSTEQRIRYAPAPVRNFAADYDYDEAQLVDLQYRLYQTSVSTLAIPYWQYQFFLNATSAINTNEIYFDPTYTNLKTGDRLFIVDNADSPTISPIVVTIEDMLVNGCRITSQLPVSLESGWTACPLYAVFAEDPQFDADSVTGTFRINGENTDRGRTLTREDVSQTLTLYNGLPVLDYKVLAGIREGYNIEFEDLASPFGRRERSVIWTEPQLLRSVAFRVNRKKTLSDYDYATLFFDYCAGQHKPFFISSNLEDLIVDPANEPTDGSSNLQVLGTVYPDTYFGNPIYGQLEIEFTDGTYLWYTVNTAVSQVGGTSLLTLQTALPNDVETNKIARISYLYRARLATDVVNVNHRNNRTTFSFSIKGTAS